MNNPNSLSIHSKGQPSPAVHGLLASDLAGVFVAFEKARVPYVVLRGFDPISELSSSLDIDTFIPPEHLQTARLILEQAGWRFRRFQTGRMPHVFFDKWDGKNGLVRSFDVVTDLCFGERAYHLRDARSIFASTVDFGGVRVPAPWHAALCFTLHALLDKGSLSAANARRAAAMRERCEGDTGGREQLAALFGTDALELTESFFAWSRHPLDNELPTLVRRARSLSSLSARPFAARVHAIQARWRQLRRPVARVAILGIDGSGKSTLVEMASRRCGTVAVHNGYLGHNHYRTLPAKFLTRTLQNTREFRPNAGLRIRVLANLEVLWRPVELATRMLIAEHRSELVLYDRFPIGQDDDSPTTSWGKLVSWYTRTTRALLPGPDLVILLDGDDSVIWSRKKEMPFELHQTTQARYRALIKTLPYDSTTVRTDGSLEDAFASLQSALALSNSIQRKFYEECNSTGGLISSEG